MRGIATHLSRRPYSTGVITHSVRWIGADGRYHRLSFGACSEQEAIRRKAEFDAAIASGVPPEEVCLSDILANEIRADRSPYEELYRTRLSESIQPKELQALALRSAEALKQALASVKPLRQIKSIKSNKETIVVTISDPHVGKSIKDGKIYNPEIACDRIIEIGRKSAHLIDKHIAGGVDEIVVALVGDIADGWGIYPGQSFRTDCPVPEQVYMASIALRALIAQLRATVGPDMPIRIKAVRGNHGRVHKEAHPDTNWDMSVYYSLLLMLAEGADPLIDMEFPEDADFLNFKIKGHKIHMRHKAPSQAETAGGRSTFSGWLARHEFDLMLCANLHHIGVTEIHNKLIIRNSAPFDAEDDLPERMGVNSRASQWVFGVTEKRIPTFLYPIFFEED